MPAHWLRSFVTLVASCAGVLWTSAASGQNKTPPPPPGLTDLVFEDSVWAPDYKPDRKWTYRFGYVEGEPYGWVEITDAFGGRVVMPRAFFHQAADRSAALRNNDGFRVIATPTRTQFYAILGLIAFGILSAAGLPIVFFRRRLVRERDQRRRLQETARQLAESREDERMRIARDLHDGPLQDLHALHMQLGVAADALVRHENGPAPEAGRVRGAQDEAHTVIGELRGIAESLRPPALGPFGLAAALKTYAERFRRNRSDIAVDLDLDDDGLVLPESVRLALFRIAQEALNNAAKHGTPSRVAITFRMGDYETSLVIRDDGLGLTRDPDEDTLVVNGHFGVLGMRERAGAIDGTIVIAEPEGGGVEVRVDVPRGRLSV